jgi:hypothetical protein
MRDDYPANATSLICGKFKKIHGFLAGERFTLVEVREGDVVCGIEVTTGSSSSNDTVSTAIMTEDISGSWSLSSHSLSSGEDATESISEGTTDLSAEPPLFLNPSQVHNFSYGNCSPVYGLDSSKRRNRVFDKTTTSELQLVGTIVFEDSEDCCTSEQEPINEDTDSTLALAPTRYVQNCDTVGTVSANMAMDISSRNLSRLLELNSLDTTQLLESFRSGVPRYPFLDLALPEIPMTISKSTTDLRFSLFSENQSSPSSTAAVVVGNESNAWAVTKMRDLAPKLLSQGDCSVAIVGLELINWRDSLMQLKKVIQAVKTEVESHTSASNNHVSCCAPPCPISPESSVCGGENLFRDKELGAIMKLTNDGSHTNSLFPSVLTDFPDDGMSFEDDDDGLGDELVALDTIEDDLRKELEATEMIVKSILSTTSEFSSEAESLSTVINDKEGDSTALYVEPVNAEYIARDLEASAIFLHNKDRTLISNWDSMSDAADSVTILKGMLSLEESIDNYIKRPLGILVSGRKYSRPARHVRFADKDEEFSYQGIVNKDTEEDSDDRSTGDLQGAWEDFYAVCENLIDELTLACTRTVDKAIPSERKICSGRLLRSSVHY